MARTFPLLLLGALTLLQAFSAQTFDVPKADFSVLPDAFSLGSQFTATCTVSGFDPSKYFQYSVVFYVKPSETRLAVFKKTPRIDLDLAKWSVYPSSTITFLFFNLN